MKPILIVLALLLALPTWAGGIIMEMAASEPGVLVAAQPMAGWPGDNAPLSKGHAKQAVVCLHRHYEGFSIQGSRRVYFFPRGTRRCVAHVSKAYRARAIKLEGLRWQVRSLKR